MGNIDALKAQVQDRLVRGEITHHEAYDQLLKLAELEPIPSVYRNPNEKHAMGAALGAINMGNMQAGAVPIKVYHPNSLPAWGTDSRTQEVTSAGYLFMRFQYMAQNAGIRQGMTYMDHPNEGGLFGLRGVTIMSVGRIKDKVIIFLVYKGETPMTLEDDFKLFPSDGLMTRLISLVDAVQQ